MKSKINLWVILRIAIGIIFLVSGSEKVLHPYQNFLYVVQSYDFLSSWGDHLAARVIPWLELFTGFFLIIGLWTVVSLVAAAFLFSSFMVTVGQALIRHLPLQDCGCFGSLISLPPLFVFVMDSVFLVLTISLLKRKEAVLKLSVDNLF